MPLFDLGAAWDAMDPKDQRTIGMAAIAVIFGTVGDKRSGGRVPGYSAAFEAGLQTIVDIIATSGLLPPEGDVPMPNLDAAFGIIQCHTCGCTDDHACHGRCWWVQTNLCSSCAAKPQLKAEAVHA